ncbi:MAG TPA: tyrosine-type recombinase/integrase [Pseudonocardia sp.]|jgi:integrase|nr:tyrosine-type recombinase/integrase [Pseudonocardia sp.]
MPKGSIETLRTGFRARVYAGKDPITGKQLYVRGETRRDRREAEADAERLVADVEADRRPDQHATVSMLLDRWVEVVDHELSTADTTAGYIRRTIKPALGDMPLRKLQHRVDVLDRLYTHLRRCNQLCDGKAARRGGPAMTEHVCTPMSPAAVRRVHAILSAALNYAISWGWIERNPADYAHPPKLTRRKAQPPKPEQVAALLNAAVEVDEELAVFLWLAVTTGARRGELTALRWSDVDLERGLLRVSSSYVVRAGQRRLKSPKTGDERLLSLDSTTVQMLTDLHDVRADALAEADFELRDSAFVFSPEPLADRPWHPDHFTHAYREVARPLGIVEPLKNLRHFNATQLLAAGVDLRTTAGRLGHRDGGATTLRVYASWTKPADLRAAEMLAHDLGALREQAALAGGSENGTRGVRRAALIPARSAVEILADAEAVTNYLELADRLRAAIRAGRLGPGERVPSAPELARHAKLALSTVSRAVNLLGREGVLEKVSNRWTVTGTDAAATIGGSPAGIA